MPNITGYKWGYNALGTPGGVLTWSIAGGGLSLARFGLGTRTSVNGESFMNFDFEGVIQQAFADWSTFGDVEFLQVNDPGGAAGTGGSGDRVRIKSPASSRTRLSASLAA